MSIGNLSTMLSALLSGRGKCSCGDDFLALTREMRERFDRIDKQGSATTSALARVLAAVEPPAAVRFVITVMDEDGGNSMTYEEGRIMDAIVGGKKRLVIQPVDQFGNPAPTDGPPKWESTGDAIKAITVVSDDGLQAVVEIGTVANLDGQVTVTADGKLGPDVALFHSAVDFHSIAGDAVAFNVSVTDEPAAPAPVTGATQ